MADQSNIPTKELVARDLAVLWHPCSQMRDYHDFEPLHVVGAKGSRLHLADGSSLIDAISSWWCKSLGHGHPRLQAALIAQAQQFEHVILANTTNEKAVTLCERLCELANGNDDLQIRNMVARATSDPAQSEIRNHFTKVFLAGDGSVGMEIALKMAFQAQQQRGQTSRTRFAHFAHGYHGETIATLAVGDCGLYGSPFAPLFFNSIRLENIPYRTGPGDPRWMDASDEWARIEKQLEAHAQELAGIVYEPVLQGAGGMKLYSPDLLPRLTAWAQAHGVFTIADEIASGLGRLGTPLASHLGQGSRSKVQGHQTTNDAIDVGVSLGNHDYVLPDIVVLSKGLTSGYMPLSAVLTTQSIYDIFDADYHEGKAFLHSNTYTGHALAVAVAHATLDVMHDEHIYAKVARHGPLLYQGLYQLSQKYSLLHNLRGCGMMAAVDLRHADGSPLDPRLRTGWQVYRSAVKRGVLLRNLGDTMYLYPPLNISPDDIAEM
ncbi:MAG: aminotransferase class III-fold pyridoxal phosphate-dependent enzyme, partial [Phycisphaerales bacterium]|nr:aminotransferase class III-fold pyridoxal phosphate-dependent enzyme [Phycisphaerales bacterium]